MIPKVDTTAVLILLSALTVFVYTANQPSHDRDASDQMKELITKQQLFQEKLRQQAETITKQGELITSQRDDFEEKLRQQAETITKQGELITSEREDFEEKLRQQAETITKAFEEKLQRQDDRIQTLAGEVTYNRLFMRQLKKQLQAAAEDKEVQQNLLKTNIEDEHVIKRSDDTDPLEIVVNQVSQKLNDVTAEIQTLKNRDETLSRDIATARDSVYVRWGSSACANSTQLIYTGVIGGSFYSHSGGAANPLCLPLNPIYSETSQGSGISHASLYGSEYEVSPEPSHNLDAVCAVCRSAHATTIMIPATSTCYPGWSLQYSGYIMASRPDDGRAGTEFICVDSKLEGRIGTTENYDGFVLYYTESRCGSLPCPPYVEGKVVICVVCSK